MGQVTILVVINAFAVPGKWTSSGLSGKSLPLRIEYFRIHAFRSSVFLDGFFLPIVGLILETESSKSF